MRADLAFVFPGQGSQSIGMMNTLVLGFDVVGQRFETASQILGFDLWRLVQEGPESQLNETANTQPALLAASVATWDIWRACGGVEPALMAGHSFGEYSALVCAGALAYEDAVSLVADRGRYMQEAVPPGQGGMAAILGMDMAALNEVCAQASEGAVVQCANLNAPGQIVISGERAAVERAIALAKAQGAKRAIALAVSVPAHCTLMQPAAQRFEARIRNVPIASPRIPVIHNADVSPHALPDEIRRALVAQLTSPVRWHETIEAFAAAQIRNVIECGPGKVLSPLVKRCANTLNTFMLSTKDEIMTTIANLENS